MVLKNMGLVKGLGPTLYFNDRYWEVIKVWGMVMWLHLVQMINDVPGKFNIAKEKKRRKKKIELWRSH